MSGAEGGGPAVDAVVWDFGGVFMASPFEAMRQLAEDRGIPHELAIEVLFGSYDADTDHPWHRAERGELDVVSARDQIREIGRGHGHDLDLFELMRYLGGGAVNEAMVELVRRVRAAGVRTAVLTNNIVEAKDMWRGLVPVDELFDVIVDSSEVGMRKPNPAIYHHTLAELGGVEPERAAFLDDYPGNVAAASAIGMIGILVELDATPAIAAVDALLT